MGPFVAALPPLVWAAGEDPLSSHRLLACVAGTAVGAASEEARLPAETAEQCPAAAFAFDAAPATAVVAKRGQLTQLQPEEEEEEGWVVGLVAGRLQLHLLLADLATLQDDLAQGYCPCDLQLPLTALASAAAVGCCCGPIYLASTVDFDLQMTACRVPKPVCGHALFQPPWLVVQTTAEAAGQVTAAAVLRPANRAAAVAAVFVVARVVQTGCLNPIVTWQALQQLQGPQEGEDTAVAAAAVLEVVGTAVAAVAAAVSAIGAQAPQVAAPACGGPFAAFESCAVFAAVQAAGATAVAVVAACDLASWARVLAAASRWTMVVQTGCFAVVDHSCQLAGQQGHRAQAVPLATVVAKRGHSKHQTPSAWQCWWAACHMQGVGHPNVDVHVCSASSR